MKEYVIHYQVWDKVENEFTSGVKYIHGDDKMHVISQLLDEYRNSDNERIAAIFHVEKVRQCELK